MVGKNNAALIAQIGAMSIPEITEGKSIDFAGIVDSYNKGKQLAEQRKEKQLQDTRRQALTDAINSGDETAINSAWAAYDPKAYADMSRSDKQRAEERKWALDDMATKFQNDLALAKAKDKSLVNINMSNPFDKKRVETRASNMDENIAKSQSQIDTYNKAEALLNKGTFDTGGVNDFFAPITTRFNQDAADFQAEVNKIVPTMRPTGSGSTSDRDMAVFEKATFGFGKPKQTNLNIIQGRRAVEENNIAKEELFAQYITSGMGTPADFDREWRKYLNANPIFGDDKGGTLNKNRVDAYTWFSNPQAPSLKNFNQTKDFSGMSDEDLLKGL